MCGLLRGGGLDVANIKECGGDWAFVACELRTIADEAFSPILLVGFLIFLLGGLLSGSIVYESVIVVLCRRDL